jgi:hypothetical protein
MLLASVLFSLSSVLSTYMNTCSLQKNQETCLAPLDNVCFWKSKLGNHSRSASGRSTVIEVKGWQSATPLLHGSATIAQEASLSKKEKKRSSQSTDGVLLTSLLQQKTTSQTKPTAIAISTFSNHKKESTHSVIHREHQNIDFKYFQKPSETLTATKIGKNRFNFASFDCGSLILAANPGSKESSSILFNSKDKYMLNECLTKQKFVEVELCQEILVEKLCLANYELFSSVFKEFFVFVNNRYPPSQTHPWRQVGRLTAKNIRGKQVCILHFSV